MDEVEKMENHLSSAAAFVEGGIQDACDDACSICLEAFCDSDPSTVTTCKHDYHLQCILEWCQRSSQCPMCWQPISLKEPSSQELLEAVERERNIRLNQTRPAAIFHYPALGDFDLQHLADADFEERIVQHLAAAAIGRAHHLTRREGQRDRSGSHGWPQFLVFSPHANATSIGSVSASSVQRGDNESTPSIVAASPSAFVTLGSESSNQESHTTPVQPDHSALLTSGISSTLSRAAGSGSRTPAGQSTPVGQDSAGPSDLQSFSETLKSRLNAVSMRYKESFTKSTRGWRERLFSRNSPVTDIGSEVRREVNAGIATVSRMMESLDTRERRTSGTTGSSNTEVQSAVGPSTEEVAGNREGNSNDTSTSASCIAASGSN